MNDEIKEILDKIKDCNWYEELDLTGTMWIELRWEETHLLLNYISNLQKDVDKLTSESTEWESKCYDLQEENETLRKNQRYYKNGVFSLEYDKETLSDMIDDYKSRNEKAIETLKDTSVDMPSTLLIETIDYARYILKGDNGE